MALDQDNKRKAAELLREVVKHRLAMWNAAAQAEKLLGDDVEVVTAGDQLDDFACQFGNAGDVDEIPDDAILSALIFE